MSQRIKKPISKGAAKVPVVMQLEALECGAACLDMILAYYGKWLPLERVRMDCGVSRDGSKAKNILKAARSYGLMARGFKFEPEALKESGRFPCIIHWNFNHFVVLCGFKGGRVYLNDPARGSCSVTEEEFDESFTGVTLMMEPSEDFVPEGKPASMLDFARKRLAGSRAAVIFVALVSLIVALVELFDPVFTRVFVDYLLTDQHSDWLVPFLWTLGGLCIIVLVLSWVRAVYSLKLNGKMAAVGNSSYMWKVLNLPMQFFSQRIAGDILSRKAANSTVTAQLVNTIAPLALNFVMMIFYLFIMLRYSVLLSLIGIASILINLVLSRIIVRKRINTSRVLLRDEGKLSGSTVSGIEMIETIKSSGAENGFFERWSGYQASVNLQLNRGMRMNYGLGLLPTIVSQTAGLLILGIGVLLTFSGELTLGMLMAFQGFFESFSDPANELVDAGHTISEMRTQAERIGDVMDYPNDYPFAAPLDEDEASGFQKLRGDIELRNVTFGYSPLEEPLIRDFNLHIRPGSRVAIVGMSGCGKSTITKLVSGLYQPWSGEILYDGKHIGEIEKEVFTGSLAVVDQDIVLFDDTIENNIKMWDRSIEDFEMILAARDAQIHEDILMREGGFQYRIAEGGKDFSGGQRQRLEIARVLAQDPAIVILDEATSALDARTEFDVVSSINARGITCIIVAHRLSTIRDCDEIIVLDHGIVVERGTHDELMKCGGCYVQLVSSN